MNVESRVEAKRHVDAQKMARLSNWADRKPVIALMGEFSSGKSTLLNLLVGQSILPMQVTATRLPPVWFQYGDKPAFWMDKEGQRHNVDLDDLGSVPMDQARFIRIYAISDQLKKCDLIDTPGISDPNIPTDSWIKTIGYANSVLWCTHAGQAWRESERSQWENLPARLRENSVLLVTRADKIVSRVDLDKLHRRLQRETSELFSKHHFISLTMAMQSREEGAEENLWVKSGGEVFMNSFEDVLSAVNTKRKNLLGRYQVIIGIGRNDAPQASKSSTVRSDENTADKAESNVSILRPTRIRPGAASQRPARLNIEEAANRRIDMLSKPTLVEDNGAPTQAIESEGKNDELRSANNAPSENPEAISGGDSDKNLLTSQEASQQVSPPLDQGAIISSENESGEIANEVSEVPTAAEDDVSATTEGEVSATVEDGVSTDVEGEISASTEDEVSADVEGEVSATEEDEVSAATEDETSVAVEDEISAYTEDEVSADVEGEVSAPTEDDVPATEEDVVNELEAEAPSKNQQDAVLGKIKSASETWQEIISSQEIETVPQILEAISHLLEQLDENRAGSHEA